MCPSYLCSLDYDDMALNYTIIVRQTRKSSLLKIYSFEKPLVDTNFFLISHTIGIFVTHNSCKYVLMFVIVSTKDKIFSVVWFKKVVTFIHYGGLTPPYPY